LPPWQPVAGLADLLANDSDPDGDTMTIVGLSETSTNGALMDRDTTFIYYTPRETNTGVGDQFAYTVSDGRGGLASTTVGGLVRAASRLIRLPGS